MESEEIRRTERDQTGAGNHHGSHGTVVTLTTEPDGSSDAQQDADTPQDDAARDDTPQDAAGENDQDSTTQDDTGSDAEQQ